MHADRRAIPVDDLVEAERFYGEILTEVLGGYLANRYGLTTDEIIQARRAGALAAKQGDPVDANEMALPYSRVILGESRQSHVYLQLTDRHLQEAPPEQLRGTPRLAFSVSEEQLSRATRILGRHGVGFEGPVTYPAPSLIRRALYFKDPAGNFLELCCPRERQAKS